MQEFSQKSYTFYFKVVIETFSRRYADNYDIISNQY